jgi:scyllo-inositol 2-dehydrogenase (NADP+)
VDSADIRVALLGYGIAGAYFHAPFISAVDGLTLAGVVTRNEERRAQARREHPGTRLLDRAEEVWSRTDEFDLVVVATPNRSHVPLAREALEAGLAVVVDKPMAATADEARDLVALAERRNVFLTVFQNRRWDGDFLTTRALVDEGTLGRVLRFESRFERWRPELTGNWRERGQPEEAGGVLYDLGSHLIDQALALFGPATRVYAELAAQRPGAEADDDAFVALTHESGVRSHLWMSAVAAALGPRFRLLGDRGAYVKYGLDVQEDALRAGHRPDEAGWGEEPEEKWGVLTADGETRALRTEPGAYQRFYEGLVAALRDESPPPVDPKDAVAALEVIDAARASAGENRVVELT